MRLLFLTSQSLLAGPGAKKWEFATGGGIHSSPVIGADGTVYFGASDMKFYALDCASGAKKWEFATEGAIWSSPAIGTDGTATQTFVITLQSVNDAPVLASIRNKIVSEFTLLTFTATATDADLPAQTLIFTLDVGAPLGASITVGGVFTWTPSLAQAGTNYSLILRVRDDGSPALSSENTFVVEVKQSALDKTKLRAIVYDHGQFRMEFNSQVGVSYTLQSSTNLLDWQDLWTNNASGTAVELRDTNAVNFRRQLYRLRQ